MKNFLFAALLAVVALPAQAESTNRTIDFGTVDSNDYVSRILRLNNTEPNPINLDIDGGNFYFRIATNCPRVLPAGDNCTIRITFHPTSPGRSFQSYLKITGNEKVTNFTLRGWSR